MDQNEAISIVVSLARCWECYLSGETIPLEHTRNLHGYSEEEIDEAIETVNTMG